MMMKNIFVLLIFVFCTNIASSQQDSFPLNKNKLVKKHWLLPIPEVTAINILVNRFDVYALKAEWAKVSPSTWKRNIQRGFESDGDSFNTNFFGHPVHGSLYYNSARSLGNNFWQSALYTVGGSLMWEFLGETLPASEIDINTTVQGGMYIGEVTNRLSKALLRDNKNRQNKFIRNATAVVINPMAQVNRWFYDDVKQSFISNHDEEPLIRSQISIGLSTPLLEFDRINVRSTAYFNFSLLYGDIFKKTPKFKPFDTFILKSWIDIGASKTIKPFYINIVSRAAWFKKEIGENSILSISQHYDYLDNQAFKIGVTGITADFTFRKNYSNWGFVGSLNLGIIPFGSSSSTVLEIINAGEDELNATYVYGRGYMAKFEYLIYHNKFGRLTASYNHWYINTENFVQGTERPSVVQTKYYFPFSETLSIGIELLKYDRKAAYQDIPEYKDVKENYEELKLFVTKMF